MKTDNLKTTLSEVDFVEVNKENLKKRLSKFYYHVDRDDKGKQKMVKMLEILFDGLMEDKHE